MQKKQILELCARLRIGTYIGEIYPQIQAQSHEEFLIKLLNEAVLSRQTQRRNRFISSAGFELIKSVDTFDFSQITLPDSLAKQSLLSCEFVKDKQNLILYGHPGTGKTHLATALGVEACKKDFRVIYFKTSKLVNLLAQARQNNVVAKFWKKLANTDLLILDELGYIPFERVGTQLLFEAISDCYEKRSVIITTNLPFDEWNTVFYDQKLTTAILDRIVHHGRLILHDGPSYRLHNSKMQ